MSNLAKAKQILQDNNARGMSSAEEPIHWNLHNCMSLVIKAAEELKKENIELREQISLLEQKLRNM